MKPRYLQMALLLSLMLPLWLFGQPLAGDNPNITERERAVYNLKYAQTEPDTFEFSYQKSPGLAFLLSAAVPGAGEFYSGAKYRAAAFFGVEVISWIVYFNRKSVGEQLEKDYKKWADTYWNAWNWYANGLTHRPYLGIPDSTEEASHLIYFEYNGEEYPSNTAYLDENLNGWESLLESGELAPIKTRDYYENIGKYDQFASGWADFNTIEADMDTSIIPNSARRSNYLNQRYDSNQALKMATNFATVVMFNHLISAFHAQIAAKQYRGPDKKEITWNVGLVTDYTYKNPIRGLTLSFAF
jgi:hypothetical protein